MIITFPRRGWTDPFMFRTIRKKVYPGKNFKEWIMAVTVFAAIDIGSYNVTMEIFEITKKGSRFAPKALKNMIF